MPYPDFKAQMLARTTGLDIDKSGDFDCVDVAKAYAEHLFPGVGWAKLIGYGNAKDLWGKINEQYFTKIANNPNDPAQLPPVGAIMLFDKTPYPGYKNTYDNPYGHIGINDGANNSGYNLLQQSSGTGRKPWIQYAPWNYRRCLGWYVPKEITQPQGGNTMALHPAFVTNMYRYVGGREPVSSDVKFHSENSTPEGLMDGFIRNNDLALPKTRAALANAENNLRQRERQIDELNAALDNTRRELEAKARLITSLQQQLTEARANASQGPSQPAQPSNPQDAEDAAKWRNWVALNKEIRQ